MAPILPLAWAASGENHANEWGRAEKMGRCEGRISQDRWRKVVYDEGVADFLLIQAGMSPAACPMSERYD